MDAHVNYAELRVKKKGGWQQSPNSKSLHVFVTELPLTSVDLACLIFSGKILPFSTGILGHRDGHQKFHGPKGATSYMQSTKEQVLRN